MVKLGSFFYCFGVLVAKLGNCEHLRVFCHHSGMRWWLIWKPQCKVKRLKCPFHRGNEARKKGGKKALGLKFTRAEHYLMPPEFLSSWPCREFFRCGRKMCHHISIFMSLPEASKIDQCTPLWVTTAFVIKRKDYIPICSSCVWTEKLMSAQVSTLVHGTLL